MLTHIQISKITPGNLKELLAKSDNPLYNEDGIALDYWVEFLPYLHLHIKEYDNWKDAWDIFYKLYSEKIENGDVQQPSKDTQILPCIEKPDFQLIRLTTADSRTVVINPQKIDHMIYSHNGCIRIFLCY
jgi:hypothetical protein